MIQRIALALALAAGTLLLPACSSWWAPPPVSATPALERLHAQGADALLRNDLDAAIAAWRRYVAAAPPEEARARQLRGWLTLLERQAAQRFAQAAVARERSGAFQPTNRLHVAVFPFAAQGPGGAGFQRAAVAMISTDLAQVPALTVLERARIEQLLQELKLADSGLVDAATAATRGRLLGAGTVVAGSVLSEPGPAGPGSGRYKLNTAVADVGGRRVLSQQEVEGLQAEFFVLQKRAVYGILETLGITELPPGVHKVHTRNWLAYARFAAGLQLLAEDRFDEARQAFQAALAADPRFDLAQEALLDTPEQGLTLEQMKARLRR